VPESESVWEARFGGHGVVTDMAGYKAFYGLTDKTTDYTGLSSMNQQNGTLNIPINCQKRDSTFLVTYQGTGVNAFIKTKHCGWFVGNTANFCPLLDLDPQRTVNGYRARVWQVCQQECKDYTRCDQKMAGLP
jgi:hypothetical protein